MADLSLPLSTVFAAAARSLDDGALGALSGALACAAGARRGSALLHFLATFGLWPRLASADFVEGLCGARDGAGAAPRLSGPRVIRLALAVAPSAPRAAAAVLDLLRAGALDSGDLLSRRALAPLHALLRAPDGLAAAGALLAGVASEMDSYAQVGALLASFLGARGGGGGGGGGAPTAEQARALIQRVCASEDVRDLTGHPRDLMQALPAHAQAVAAALAAVVEDSDEDDAGNLAGFVCGDDEVVYSTDSGRGEEEEDEHGGDEEEEEEEDDDDDSEEEDDAAAGDERDGGGGGAARSRGMSAASLASSVPVVAGGRRARQAAASHATRPQPPPPKRRRDTDADGERAAAASRYIDSMALR